MKQDIIHTVIYYRKSTKEEVAAGAPKCRKTRIVVPVEDVFLGMDKHCFAVFKPTVLWEDGLRYYYECINLAELL